MTTAIMLGNSWGTTLSDLALSLRMVHTPLRRFGIYLGIWTLAAIYLASTQMIQKQGIGLDATLRFFWFYLILHYGWALVSLLTLSLLKAVPLHRRPSTKAWAIHFFASILITTLGICLSAAWPSPSSARTSPYLTRAWFLLQFNFHYSYLIYYWGVVVAHECILLFRQILERQQAAIQLKSRLAQAQMETLKLQLSPHFLFNTLNAVAALMYSDPGRADRILIKFSNLLRMSLNTTDEQETTLNQELNFIENYLEIEKLRFGNRLIVEIQVSPMLYEALVPTFLLQPLVENAIKHGITPRASGGKVVIRARRENSKLVLEVEDDGPGAPEKMPILGPGTLNAKSRLLHLYGDSQFFEHLFPTTGGALTRISLPFSLARDPLIRTGDSL